MISRLFTKWKLLAYSNKGQHSFTIIQILRHSTSPSEHSLKRWGDGSPCSLPQSIHLILKLYSGKKKLLSRRTGLCEKPWLPFSLISQINWRMLQKLREQLFPSKNMEKTCYVSTAICSFPGEVQPWGASYHQGNYRYLCLISLYIFKINTVMVRRLPNDRLIRMK